MSDRSLFKNMQEGQAVTAGLSDAHGTVRDVHTKAINFLKAGTENAATNVAESPMFYVGRKSKPRAIGIQVTTNVAANAANYVVLNFYKRYNGTSTLVGSWNTSPSAQGALTTANSGVVAAGAGLVTNSQAEIPAGYFMTYDIKKYGTGQLIDVLSTFTVDLEEI